MNIIFQALLTLVFPIGLGVLVAYLLTEFANAKDWVYAPLIIFGVFTGLISMVKFVLSAMSALERLEKQQNKNTKNENLGNTNTNEQE